MIWVIAVIALVVVFVIIKKRPNAFLIIARNITYHRLALEEVVPNLEHRHLIYFTICGAAENYIRSGEFTDEDFDTIYNNYASSFLDIVIEVTNIEMCVDNPRISSEVVRSSLLKMRNKINNEIKKAEQDFVKSNSMLAKAARMHALLYKGVIEEAEDSNCNPQDKPGSSNIEDLINHAKKGDSHAQLVLGARYKNGDGVEKSEKDAVFWIKKAAKQDNLVAQFVLGFAYQNGEGVDQSIDTAMMWFKEAAENGHVDSQYHLSTLYLHGDQLGIESSYEKAFYWTEKAAEKGFPKAEGAVSIFYKYGLGTEKSIDKSTYWAEKAERDGDVSFKDFEKRLQEKIG